jgi:hypothetical protein
LAHSLHELVAACSTSGIVENSRSLSSCRTWEERHLDSTFNFQMELGAKVKTLLKFMEHPINMAHLSKLFAAQLIISCNFDVCHAIKSPKTPTFHLPNDKFSTVNYSKLSLFVFIYFCPFVSLLSLSSSCYTIYICVCMCALCIRTSALNIRATNGLAQH